MTTTPNPTAEQIVAEAFEGTLITHRRELDEAQRADVGRIAISALRAHGLLSEGAPSEEQIERAALAAANVRRSRYGLPPLPTLGDDSPSQFVRQEALAALTAAGVASQPVIDEAALTEVIFNAVEKWADMYPTPQVSEMIARAVAAWLKDGSAAQEPRVECLEVRHPSGERQPAYVESTDRQKLIDEAQAFERAPKLGLSAHRELDKAILLIRRLWPALDAPLDPEKVAEVINAALDTGKEAGSAESS